MIRELPGAIVYVIFLGGFVYLMNYISNPTFNGDSNYFTYIAVGIIVFATLMMYWERIFPRGNREG